MFYFGNLLLSLTGSLMSILCKIHGTDRLLLNPEKKTKRKRKNRFKLNKLILYILFVFFII